MKKTLAVLIALAPISAFAESQCAMMYRDFRSDPSKEIVVEGTELKLNRDAEGRILGAWNRKEWKIKDAAGADRTFFFVIDEFRRDKNGCHYIYTATGLLDDRTTWFNTMNNWCEGDDLQIYHPALTVAIPSGASVTCRF